MAIVSRAQLKKWFQNKAYPTAEQFATWIDSFFHKDEDKLPIDAIDGLSDQLNSKYAATAGNELQRRVTEIDTRVSDLDTTITSQFEQIADQQDAQDVEIEALRVRAHFRGYLVTNAAIKALAEPTEGDYAYSAESGTKWLYDEIAAMWSDTGLAVPDQTVPPSDDLPLPDGKASSGKGTSYSRFDHRHPTDTTRAADAEVAKLAADNHLTGNNTFSGITGYADEDYVPQTLPEFANKRYVDRGLAAISFEPAVTATLLSHAAFRLSFEQGQAYDKEGNAIDEIWQPVVDANGEPTDPPTVTSDFFRRDPPKSVTATFTGLGLIPESERHLYALCCQYWAKKPRHHKPVRNKRWINSFPSSGYGLDAEGLAEGDIEPRAATIGTPVLLSTGSSGTSSADGSGIGYGGDVGIIPPPEAGVLISGNTMTVSADNCNIKGGEGRFSLGNNHSPQAQYAYESRHKYPDGSYTIAKFRFAVVKYMGTKTDNMTVEAVGSCPRLVCYSDELYVGMTREGNVFFRMA